MTMKTAMMALAVFATMVCHGQGLATVQGGPTNLVATGRRRVVGDTSLRSYPTPKTADELRGFLYKRNVRKPTRRGLDDLKAAIDNTLECADYSKFKEKYGENADFKKADPDAIMWAKHIKKHKLKYIEMIVEEQEAEREEVLKKEKAREEFFAKRCAVKRSAGKEMTYSELMAASREFSRKWSAEARKRREARRKNRLPEKTNPKNRK